MQALLLIITLLFCSASSFGQTYKLAEDTVNFPGRVSRLNSIAKLARIKVDFINSKFLNNKDRVEFWNESHPGKRCMSYVEGRTNEYILLKIPKYEQCILKVHVATGSYLHFYSPDLEKSLRVAQDLVEILLKKRLALDSRLSRYKRKVDSFIEKIDTINKRYEVLRQKLSIEWKKELSSLETDKTQSYYDYKTTQSQLNELDFKLEQYRVKDQNFVEDRWSLDPQLYYKK